jgi:hypothetical protein
LRAILAVAVLLVACTPPAPLGPQPSAPATGTLLTPDDVRSTLVGNTGVGERTATTLTDWKMYVAPDGTLVQTDQTGHWNITDNGQFCMQWPFDFEGHMTCQNVYRDGDRLELRSATSVEKLAILPGNQM